MEKDTAYKTFEISPDTPMTAINKLYLQKSEYYSKQLEDLKNLAYLSAEQTKLSAKLSLLKEAYISLGGYIDKPPIQPIKEEHKTSVVISKKISGIFKKNNTLTETTKVPTKQNFIKRILHYIRQYINTPLVQSTSKKSTVDNDSVKKTSESIKENNPHGDKDIVIFILTIIAISALCYFAYVTVQTQNNQRDSLTTAKQIELETQIKSLQEQKKAFQLRYENSEKKLKEIAKETPFIISAISFVNVDDKGNNQENGRIFAFDNVYHITPVLTIIKINDNWKGKIQIKYISPNRTIEKYYASPPGFTLGNDLNLDSSGEIVQIKGLGYAKESEFSVGKYEVEIWCNNKILGKETFKIQE